MQVQQNELFSLRTLTKLPGATCYYDVKFYPFTAPGDRPVFAVTGEKRTFVCRCTLQNKDGLEILRRLDHGEDENSVEWSRAANGDPLACVAGSPQIKIYNVKTGQLVHTLTGHGDAVFDIAVSPTDPMRIASASWDHSVRIWSLDPAHSKQPLAAVAFGAGHDQHVLSLGWHRKGKYLLSGGMDTRLNLWMLPNDLEKHLGTDVPARIHYPYFSSTEIHTDYIDCVRFYNDLILSRAAKENKILLWKIDGFNSDKPPPKCPPIPSSQAVCSDTAVKVPTSQNSGTRSAWGGRFQVLLRFDQSDCPFYYIRFGLFHQASMHPILGAGNTKGRMYFWDLQKLEEAPLTCRELNTNDKTKKDGPSASASARSGRQGNVASGKPATEHARKSVSGKSTAPAAATTAPIFESLPLETARRNLKALASGIGNPFKPIKAHKTHVTSKDPWTVRQVAFSPDGQWCVACGSSTDDTDGMIAVFSRWEDGIPEGS